MNTPTPPQRQHSTLMVRCKGFGRDPEKSKVITCGPGLSIAQDTPMIEGLDQASALGWQIETSYNVGADGHITFVLSKTM